MGKNSGLKRVLSVLLTLALLVSSMAVAVVSAGGTEPEAGAWSFETEAEGTTLDLNSSSTESITVISTERHSGAHGVRVDSRTSGGDLRPQMMVKDADGNQVMVEAGKDYRITFWAMVPTGMGGFSSGLNVWFTAATDTNCYNISSYKKTAYVIAEDIASQTQGQWQQITVDVEDCPLSGMLRLGICADSRNNTTVHFFLDDIKVGPKEVNVTPPEEGAWSFETEAETDSALHINSPSDGTATVTSVAQHTGAYAVRVDAKNSSGNGRPQINVKDAAGNLVQVEEGKDYRVSFWAMVPQGGHDYDYNFWLTAVPEGQQNAAHNNSFPKNTYAIYDLGVNGIAQSVEKGVWQKISVEIDDCGHSGYLRLGIAGNGAGSTPITFYLDDFKVESLQNVPVEEGVWSFESETKNDKLNVNTSGGAITVIDEAKHSGAQSVLVSSSNSSGNGRVQMNVKKADGNLVQVEAGKDYRITFWAMVPTGGRDNDYNFWLTAVPEGQQNVAHSGTFPKNTYAIYDLEVNGIAQSVEKGEWQQISVEIDNCLYSGYLRLGITGNGLKTGETFNFYLDDFKVEDIVIEKLDPEEGVWSFESETKNDKLNVNTSGGDITVIDEAKRAGDQSVRINSSDSRGNNRTQMNVKGADGNLVQVEAGKDYRITFWAMVPQGGRDNDYNFWLTAVPEGQQNVAHSGTFPKNTYAIYDLEVNGIAQSVEKGEWQQISVEIDNCLYSGYLRLGITGNGLKTGETFNFYLDDFKVEDIVIEKLDPEEGVWSFESEAKNDKLNINTSGGAITVIDEAKHSGAQSVRINSSDSRGNNRTQMNVKGADGNLVQVEAGKDYRITFWAMVPQGGRDNGYNFWLTAVPEDKKDQVHDGDFAKDNYAIYDLKTSSVAQSAEKGEWQQITVDVSECAHSGYLRLGITGNGLKTGETFNFYLDDIKVVSVEYGAYEPQGFENYGVGEKLSLNADTNKTIIVTDEIAASGNQSARVNSNTSSGNERPQMMVKDANGRQFTVKKGRNYEVTFSLYIPKGPSEYPVYYWLTATDDEVCFSSSGPKKDDYKVEENYVKVTQGTWNNITIAISDCAYSGKLRLGITGNINKRPNEPHVFYIDNLNVVETIIDGDRFTMSFEPYEKDKVLSMNTDGASITVTDTERHAGYQSAQFVTLGSNLDAAPQMTVNNYQLDPVKVEAGKRYRVTFWVYVPLGGAAYDINYWFAATNNDTAFTAANPKKNLVTDVKTISIEEKGIWKQVMVTIENCAYTGLLRMGAAGSTNEAHTFYLDDIKVEERNNAPVDPEAMNFENLTVGKNLSLVPDINITAVVTDMDAYTGNLSAYITSNSNTGDKRPQFNVVDGKGNYVKVEKGKDYFLTFAVMVPTTESYYTFSYWAAVIPESKKARLNDPFVRGTDFVKNDYVLSEVSGGDQPTAGKWHVIKMPIVNCKESGYLRVGFTHHNAPPFTSHMYIDDIKLSNPDYVTVKFETNGAENAEDYPPITVMSETLVPTKEYVDPYRFGYEFMGWYSDPNFSSDSYVDLYSTLIVGKNGEVITLYAMWEKWTDVQAGEREESEDKFTIEYYTEKVWIGDQNVADPLTAGDAPNVNDAAPIVVTPEEKPDPQTQGGMPPWLIVVIIVAAVIVTGGGATIAAIMLKKNKKA